MVVEIPNLNYVRLIDDIIDAKQQNRTELVKKIKCNRKKFSNHNFSNISNGIVPTKRIVFYIAMVLELDAESIQLFLYLFGYALCPKNERDQEYIKEIKSCNHKICLL